MRAVLEAIDELQALRHSFPFEMDGAVVKVNRRSLYAQLGSTAKSPRWARAYKYEPERALTRIHAVTVQVGRTGVLTPVAELEPVLLAGSEIARATLHNADEIARKDIRIGDKVWVVKAGDVIPAIESVATEQRTGEERLFEMPAACPVCDGEVMRLEGEVAHRCVNPACPAQLVNRLEHFASRNALDIRALGEAVAETLVAQGKVSTPLDLYALTAPQLETLMVGDAETGLRKFGKNAQTMLDALDAARSLALDRWLFATGIPNVGVTVAENIALAHTDYFALADSPILRQVIRLDALGKEAVQVNPRSRLNLPRTDEERHARQEQHLRICGEIGVIGDGFVERGLARKKPGTSLPPDYIVDIKVEAANATLRFFASDYGKAWVGRMGELGINPRSPERRTAATDAPLAGLTFVLTGTLSQPRSAVAERIEANGGTVQDAVSKNTRYLVAGADSGGTKLNKAKDLGTEIIDEAQLEALLGTSPIPSPAPSVEVAEKKEDGYQQEELL
jgi:DNA ligase (NAD+)